MSSKTLCRLSVRNVTALGAGAAFAILVMATPALAALSVDQCKRIASVGQGVYDLAIKNGSSVADAQTSAQNTVMRRVHEESGKTIKTMEDAVVACGATGLTTAAMCVLVRGYFTGYPC
ncbi:MAG: hypothetical protein U1E87_10790 [Alphaproteobacteria bacterium]